MSEYERKLVSLEEFAEQEKIIENLLNSYEVINDKYKDMKSQFSNTENVNIEDIDAAITDLIRIYQDNFYYANKRFYEIYVNRAKIILNEWWEYDTSNYFFY